MPLSKFRDRERKRLDRLDKTRFQPKSDALSSNSRGIKEQSNSVAPLLDASGEVIPEYY